MLKSAHLIVFIIWSALCTSIFVYAVMLSLMSFASVKGDASTVGSVIALAAGSAAALSFVLRKLLLGDFSAGKIKAEDAAHRGRFIAGNIVVFALSEGVAALGFVNGISNNGQSDAWLPYLGLSLILMLAHIPLPSRFKSAS